MKTQFTFLRLTNGIIPFLFILAFVLGFVRNTIALEIAPVPGGGNWNNPTTWPNNPRTGNINTTLGSTAVTGSGTAFLTQISVGNIIKTTSDVFIGTVGSVTDDTHLTLTGGAASTNTNKAFHFQGIGPGDDLNIGPGLTATVTMNVDGTCNSISTKNRISSSSSLTIATSGGSHTLTLTGTYDMNGHAAGIRFDADNNISCTLTINANTTVTCLSIAVGHGGAGIYPINIFGTLKNNGSTTLDGGTFTYTCNPGSTVEYNGSAQTLWPTSYSNLTLSGSGTKTTTGVTVNGILSLEGTATVSNAPTYGSSATLQYNTATSRIAGVEWPASFSNEVIIANTGVITLNGAKVFNYPGSLIINLNASLATNNLGLTFETNFSNSGNFSAGSSPIVISGTHNQSISGFTTTGPVTMTKSSSPTNTATFQSNVSADALVINGSNLGTLNLGAGLTHIFSGNVTLTGGHLEGGSSTLNVNATSATAWNGNGTVFSAGTGTVNFGSSGAQTLSATTTTFNNLTLSNSDIKTFTNANIINGILSMEGTATASATPPTFGSTATLQYNTPTSRTAGIEWITPFAATGGVKIINTATITLDAASVLNPGVPLYIDNGAHLAINPTKSLTVGGTTTTSGTGTLILKSDANGTGSFITSTTGVNGTVQRYIAHTTGSDHGWHFLSSPVFSQTIQTEFVPTPPGSGTQGFFSWDEPTALWINTKDGSGNWASGFESTFTVGKGYLVNYSSDVTKNFTNVLNVSNISKSGLTRTATTHPGWNLLGNPFTSALIWNTGWTMTNIAAGAKIWNESGASYSDIAAGGIIPATQGFMVEVTSAPGSLTIPAAGRSHNSLNWYKSTGDPYIKLKATDLAGQTFQESIVTFNTQATVGYDADFDSHFLPGYAPQFYSVEGEEHLSTNVLPGMDNQTAIPFNFIKTDRTDYNIEAVIIENVPAQVYLTDLKTNKVQNLTDNNVYSFTSQAGDDPARFLLSFSHVGIETKEPGNNGIYVYNNTVFICNPGESTIEVYNMIGQKIMTEKTLNEPLYQVKLQPVMTSYYLVRLITGTKVYTEKIFVK